MIELLLQSPLDEKQRRYGEILKESGKSLLSLINDILDFSRIEAGKLELETIDFRPAHLVEEVVELFSEQCRGKGLELACLIDPEIPAVLCGDAGRLRQILLNLVGNAVKFTNRGEVVVSVAQERDKDLSSVLKFEVSDSGVGISRDAYEKIFDLFSQADSSTTRKFGGTGLGLAISRLLVQAMKGNIGVDSIEGKGSTFWFTACFGKTSDQVPVRSFERFEPEGLRVIVVDDNAGVRTALSRQLLGWGVCNEAVAGGNEALSVLRKAAAEGNRFDLALIDTQMSSMDGHRLAQEIGADPDLRGIRLVIMFALMGERSQAWEAQGANIADYLSKPVLPSALYACIDSASGLRPGKAAAVSLTGGYSPEEGNGLGLHILVAEDNPLNQEVAMSVLTLLGCTAEIVENGQKAVEAMARGEYNLVLMDCHMPQMDGFQAARAIRANERSHTPIIALTANVMLEDREQCLAAGMDDYLGKPYTVSQIRDVISRWSTHCPVMHDD